MARKSAGANKAVLIREFRSANPNAKPKVIAAALAKKGIDITPGYVSVILSLDRKRSGKPAKSRKARGRKASGVVAAAAAVAAAPAKAAARPVGRPRKTANEPTLVGLVSAKNLIHATGSAEEARRAIDAYLSLVGLA